MKTLFILRKFFLLTLVLIVYMSLTNCDMTKKDENTPPEEHCTSTASIMRVLEMHGSDYHYTYYCFKEGDYISLEYFKDDISGICPEKLISLLFNCNLYKSQTKPIQVIAQVTWGNEFNTKELPLRKEILTDFYNYSYSGDLDLSSYYLNGGSADLSLKIYFKFVSSGDNTTDQNYLKSQFADFDFSAVYYPY